MVEAVLASRYGRIRDLETDEIWSEKVTCSSNMKLKFRAE